MSQAAGFTKTKGKYVIATVKSTGSTSSMNNAAGGTASVKSHSAGNAPASPQSKPTGAGRKGAPVKKTQDSNLPKGAMTGSGYKTFEPRSWKD